VPTLDTLLVSRFEAVDPSAYEVLMSQAQEADRGGIRAPP
jgi:hypothetical protein